MDIATELKPGSYTCVFRTANQRAERYLSVS